MSSWKSPRARSPCLHENPYIYMVTTHHTMCHHPTPCMITTTLLSTVTITRAWVVTTPTLFMLPNHAMCFGSWPKWPNIFLLLSCFSPYRLSITYTPKHFLVLRSQNAVSYYPCFFSFLWLNNIFSVSTHFYIGFTP